MDLLTQLVRDEGEVLHAYQDSLGFWTIGSGILIDAKKGGGITHEENLYLLNNRVEKARAFVRTQLPWSLGLDEVRRGALENMTFNMGAAILDFHHMLAAMQTGDWATAGRQGRESLWYKQVGNRAERLMRQIETGIWQ